MSLPDFKNFTIKDWMYFIGIVFTLVSSWVVLDSKVKSLEVHAQEFQTRQIQVDAEQNENLKEHSREMKAEIREGANEIKAEIREIRKLLIESHSIKPK